MADKIKRFIEVHIPVTTCNLRCHYCYITQERLFSKELPRFEHSPNEIAEALSPQRMGGICMLNLCGGGETLLPPEVPSIVKACLETGNYVTIVTNGTLTNRFEEISTFPSELKERLFIKFSFQYLELKRTNQLTSFINNVKLMKDNKVSFSIEITPNDELVPFIEEIKNLSMDSFGALPHITIARLNTDPEIPILTKYSKEEYKKIWSTFGSPMFEFKLPLYNEKRTEFCHAGEWSFCTNINTGEVNQCYSGDLLGNIYDNIDKPLKLKPIGHKCKEPHCYNAHSFLLFGDIEDFSDITYADIRNRVCTDGSEWLQPKMKEFLNSKLTEANKKCFITRLIGYFRYAKEEKA